MAGKLDGSKSIQSGTLTTTQLDTALNNSISAGGGPKIKSLIYPGDDTAANTVGGQTIYITGSGFDSNVAVYVNGAAVPSVSYISASNVGFTTPALSSATYPVYVTNPDDGATAILVPGMIVSGEPTWVSDASLSSAQAVTDPWSISLSATGDTPLTYALAAGSSLPTGISLAANGLISGTMTSPPDTDTTYNFTIVVSDAQNQDSSKAFSVTAIVGEGVLFANNVLLIHADGTNNGNNHAFVDSSNNNFTITRNGNATQGSFSPFSQTGWSAYFDGTGDYLSLADNATLQMASGSFTIEFWWYPNSISGYQTPYDKGYSGTGGLLLQTGNGDGKTIVYASGSAALTSNTAVSVNSWTHMALVRNGTTLTLYQNGTSVGSVTNSTNFNNANTAGIGGNATGASSPGQYTINGYISNFRIVKGTALYTSGFTPSPSALTAVSNTSLLTCQSNRLVDNSTNAFTVTKNGDTKVVPFSPFAPTAAYTTASVGGSMYVDGSTGYLNLAGNSAFAIATSTKPFTIECWIYPTAVGGVIFCEQYTGSGNSITIAISMSDGTSTDNPSGSTIAFGWYNGSAWTTAAMANTTVPLNSWTHLACVFTGSTTKIYLNGVDSTKSSSPTPSTTWGVTGVNGDAWYVGKRWDSTPVGTYFTGYISNLRFVNGTAVYTTAFTPPTAPLTNIANTSLLCSFTNAQIFDQASKNVIECIGDAKVSTAQYKYGSASVTFDGNGDALKINNTSYPSLVNFPKSGYKFTIEMWVYLNSLTSPRSHLIGAWASSVGWTLDVDTNGDIFLASGSAGSTITLSSKITTGSWIHLAFVNDGTTLRFFKNGTSVATPANIAPSDSSSQVFIGCRSDLTLPTNGYIDDIRITAGYARYTSNFTAPTAAFKNR